MHFYGDSHRPSLGKGDVGRDTGERDERQESGSGWAGRGRWGKVGKDFLYLNVNGNWY